MDIILEYLIVVKNKYFICLIKMRPGMSDGRCFTTYIPTCELNSNLQNRFEINNNTEYRTFLQNNSEKLRNDFRKVCLEKEDKLCNSCFLASKPIENQTYAPSPLVPGYYPSSLESYQTLG